MGSRRGSLCATLSCVRKRRVVSCGGMSPAWAMRACWIGRVTEVHGRHLVRATNQAAMPSATWIFGISAASVVRWTCDVVRVGASLQRRLSKYVCAVTYPYSYKLHSEAHVSDRWYVHIELLWSSYSLLPVTCPVALLLGYS